MRAVRCNGGSYRIHIGIRCDKYSIVTARTEYWQVFEHYQQEKDPHILKFDETREYSNCEILKCLEIERPEYLIEFGLSFHIQDIFILVFH